MYQNYHQAVKRHREQMRANLTASQWLIDSLRPYAIKAGHWCSNCESIEVNGICKCVCGCGAKMKMEESSVCRECL